MGVQVQGQGRAGITLGGNMDFSQLGGTGSPAAISAGVFLLLLAIVVIVTLSAR